MRHATPMPTRICGPYTPRGYRHFHSYEEPLPEFPAFTHVNEAVCDASHVLHPHHHPAWEVCYLVGGRAEWTVHGERFALVPGDFFLSRPGEEHSGRPDPSDPNHNCAVGFDPSALHLAGASPLRDAELARVEADAVAPFSSRVIHAGPGPELLYRRILGELDALEADPRQRPLTIAMVQALLVELFVLVTRCSLKTAAPPSAGRGDIRGLLRWLSTRLEDPPSLDEMAACAGLSPAHLVVVCRQELGRTPLEQVTEMRIAEACKRLADPKATVTDVALGLGFCSSQYFSVVFRSYRGVTPSAWRKQ